MTKLRTILTDALILFAVSTVFVALADRAFSGLKGKIPKDDPVVTSIGQGELKDLEGIIASLEKDPKTQAAVTTRTDEHGRTSLMRAAYANLADADKLKEADDKRAPMVALLLSRGAPLDGRDEDGWTALMWAAWSGLPAVAEKLLDAGADHAASDRQGNTALIIAAQRGQAAIVKTLLAKGADKTAKNAAGKTAFDAAITGLEQHPKGQYPKKATGYNQVMSSLR